LCLGILIIYHGGIADGGSLFQIIRKLINFKVLGVKKLEMLNCDDEGIFLSHFVLIQMDVKEYAVNMALISCF